MVKKQAENKLNPEDMKIDSETMKGRFTNLFRSTPVNFDQLCIEFGVKLPNEKEVIIHTRIYMTASSYKALFGHVKGTWEKFEASYGVIKTDSKEKSSLSYIG